MATNLSTQAKNSLNLYRGGNPSTIEQLLKFQRSSIVNELMSAANASSIGDLAIKLSLGMVKA